jgi:hypothetical protein
VSHTEIAHLATAPVRAICLASVTIQRTVFKRHRRYGEPLLINKHLDGSDRSIQLSGWPSRLIPVVELLRPGRNRFNWVRCPAATPTIDALLV